MIWPFRRHQDPTRIKSQESKFNDEQPTPPEQPRLSDVSASILKPDQDPHREPTTSLEIQDAPRENLKSSASSESMQRTDQTRAATWTEFPNHLPDIASLQSVHADTNLLFDTAPSGQLDRSRVLRNEWDSLNKNMNSYTASLITTNDTRREVMHENEILFNQVKAYIQGSSDHTTEELLKIMSRQKELLDRLRKQDENLVIQSSAITANASKIFGDAAESSFNILDDQELFIRSDRTSTDDSVVDPDDIRNDQGSEVQRFLSKKRDVDLLREEMLDLEARERDILQELRQAEEDLNAIHEKLPNRKVVIPEDQLLVTQEQIETLSTENEQCMAGVSIEGETMATESLFGHEKQGASSFSQMLDDAIQDNPRRTPTFVDAYLHHQQLQAPEEYAKAEEQATNQGEPSATVNFEG